MKVKCIKNRLVIDENVSLENNWQPNLTIGKTYHVISIEYEEYRVNGDETNERIIGPCLYPKILFQVVDSHRDETWIDELDEDGEVFASGPPDFTGYFWEDFHDSTDERKIEILAKYKDLIFGKKRN
jgi:hypothetical protein